MELFRSTNIDWLGKKWYFLGFSLIFSVAGVLSMLFWHHIPKGVDFTGGTQIRVAFEFRHASWFDDNVFGLLRDHAVALCVADADDELEVPLVATANWSYLRLRRLNYDEPMLKEWVKRIRVQGWNEVFVFFKHEDEGNGPRLAQRMMDFAEEKS